MRRTLPFKYQLIAKTIEFISMHPNKDFTFVQDSAPLHCANQVQNFLKQKLKSRLVKNTDWSPKLPDCNPLDYYFRDRIQEKVYDCPYCYPFSTIDELKRIICDVWDEWEMDLPQIRKAMKRFGRCWCKRARLNRNCFWIDINEQRYLLNSLWLFSFYEIIASQFSRNQMKPDGKRKFEIIFDINIFIFRGYSDHPPYATDLSITFSVLHL